MKLFLNKATVFCLTVLICVVAVFPVSVSAASTSISVSSKSPKKGDTVKVTVRVSDGATFEASEFDLQYNPDVLEYSGKESFANGGGGIVHVVESYEAATSHSCTLTFVAKSAGASSLQVTNATYIPSSPYEEVALSGSGYNLSVADATKSGNANLKALSLSSGTLSPGFSPSRTSYTALVPRSTETCSVYATPADNAAKTTVSGSSALEIGENVRTVTVTAENGTQKVYTITITRLETDEIPTEVNPYETQIGEQTFTLATDLTGVFLPNGFSAATADYQGVTVAVAKDVNETYTIYYLKESGVEDAAFTPYLLELDQFIKLPCVTFGENTYILAEFPENMEPVSNCFTTMLTLNDFQVLCYQEDSSDPDLYYLYCFYVDKFGVYRYDKKENVLQRSPDFLLREIDAQAVEETEPQENILNRFFALSTTAKVIVLLLLAAVLVVVILFIIMISRLFNAKKKPAPFETTDAPFGNDFEEYEVEDNFSGGKK